MKLVTVGDSRREQCRHQLLFFTSTFLFGLCGDHAESALLLIPLHYSLNAVLALLMSLASTVRTSSLWPPVS